MLDLELQILHWFQSLHTPIMDKLMVAFTMLGEAGAVWIALAIILLCTKKYRMCGATMAVSLILSLIFCNGIMKPIIHRSRPFWIDETLCANLLVAQPTDFSFPSGHTSASFSAAVALFTRNKKLGIPAIVLAILISVSRLYIGVHFPTDVLVSVVLGTIYGILANLIVKFLCKLYDKKKAEKNTAN